MSFISTKAKLLINMDKAFNTLNTGYTTFGGNGYLTKEQYEKGMSLSRKMKNKSSW